MKVSLWAAELARAFWAEAGEPEPYPRNLRRPIARALPVSVVMLDHLQLDGVRAWLRGNDISCPCDATDRPLRACLAARSGHGLIFLDGTDPEDEQRFSLAHELGHFLWHYWQPRRLACQRLGGQIVEVLDGRRGLTPRERVHSLLKSVPFGLHLHLMRRGPRQEVANSTVTLAEEEADQMAYELLAPAAEVSSQAGAGRASVAEALKSFFGLPAEQAEEYAPLLLPPAVDEPLLRLLRP